MKLPALLDVGGIKVKGAFPNAFSGTTKLVSVGAFLPTERVVVIIPDVLFGVLSLTSVQTYWWPELSATQ